MASIPDVLTRIDDGTVPLTSADLRSLRNEGDRDDSEDETVVNDSDSSTGSSTRKRVSTSRIILRNMAKQQALQINAAVGDDIWKNISRLEIKDNIAEDQAIQINHGNTLEVVMALIGRQGKIIAAREKAPTHQRRDSVISR
jgi:hypothetical protein